MATDPEAISAEKRLPRNAKSPIGTTVANSFRSSVYVGYPGGWGIPKVYAAASSSPPSTPIDLYPKVRDGAIVARYSASEPAETAAPTITARLLARCRIIADYDIAEAKYA